MPGKSTRVKIRWNVEKAAERIDGILNNLRIVDTLADGRSDEINKHLSAIAQAFLEMQKVLLDFRDSL